MGPYLGDFKAGSILYFTWDTNDGNGASINPSVAGTISVYKDDNVVQSVAGITDVRAFDGVVGVHNCKIDTSNVFYAAGHDYSVVLSAATIDTQVVNATLATFSLENRDMDISALAVDNIWDELAAGHAVIGSFGQRIQGIRANTAQAGAPGTIQLDAGASAINDFYNGSIILITGGLGVRQARTITDYDGGTLTATVQPNWVTNPNITSEFVIIPSGGSILTPLAIDNILDEPLAGHTAIDTLGQRIQGIRANTAQAGAPGTIQLDAGASAINDFYNGSIILITGGLGVRQARTITDYDGGTLTATIQPNWVTNPNNTSEFVIIPSGDAILGPAAISAILDADLQLHLGVPVGGRNIGNILGQIAQSEFEQRTNIFATIPVPAQGITLNMVARGCIQYQEVIMSYTKNWAAPDKTYYLLYHYNAQHRQDVVKASLGIVW